MSIESDQLEQNPNIGALGTAKYQEANRRVKGFSPLVVGSVDQYVDYIHTIVLPVFNNSSGATRIIDRAVVANPVLSLGQELDDTGLTVEALVELGGRWEGYSWAMLGRNFEGRILSDETLVGMDNLVQEALAVPYEPPRPLPEGFSIDILKENDGVSEADLEKLATIFRASFNDYISNLFTPGDVREWLEDSSTYPFVVRGPGGEIAVVTNGDMADYSFDGKPFRFLEIGDSASDPSYRHMGLNRALKAALITKAKQLGFDSIHAETRAAWGAPNFGNAKNGMTYCGTLPMNCVITGPEDIPETQDPQLDEDHRRFGSLNVWTMTPANPNWGRY